MEGRGAPGGDRTDATGREATGGESASRGTARLRVYAWLRRRRPDLASREVALDGIDSVQGLLDAVKLEPPEEAIILVNDRRAGPATPIGEGDTVSVFPMLDGG